MTQKGTVLITNWSSTHFVDTNRLLNPSSVEEVQKLINHAHRNSIKLRPIGACMSPNGLSFEKRGMLSLAKLNKLLNVDINTNHVTVQAGITIGELARQLKPYKLTLQNFASISTQQVGGFTQAGAHGTGISIPPVEEQVVSMKLITPGLGPLLVLPNEPFLSYSKLSLGSLGVVTEVTLKCVPLRTLKQTISVIPRNELHLEHKKRLLNHQHMRYFWIPYTDSVVITTMDPTDDTTCQITKIPLEEQLKPMRDLLERYFGDRHMDKKTFFQLKGYFLSNVDAVDSKHIQALCHAEAEYWKRASGEELGSPEDLLGMDCGPQQLTTEVAFPMGTKQNLQSVDIEYMTDLMNIIESRSLPVTPPVEQRWTSGSTSKMSIVYSSLNDVYCWAGIILYLPSGDGEVIKQKRSNITRFFKSIMKICDEELWDKYDALEHWSKVEIPEDAATYNRLKSRMAKRFPLEEFHQLRRTLDPNNILSNELVDLLFTPKKLSTL